MQFSLKKSAKITFKKNLVLKKNVFQDLDIRELEQNKMSKCLEINEVNLIKHILNKEK